MNILLLPWIQRKLTSGWLPLLAGAEVGGAVVVLVLLEAVESGWVDPVSVADCADPATAVDWVTGGPAGLPSAVVDSSTGLFSSVDMFTGNNIMPNIKHR